MANGRASNLKDFLSEPDLPLPLPLAAEALARQTTACLSQNEGATFNLYFGNTAGQSLYAISLYPERSVVVPRHLISEELLRRFVEGNQDLLALNSVYLDVSGTLPDKSEALSLGEWYNQEAIYDLARNEVIDTGESDRYIARTTSRNFDFGTYDRADWEVPAIHTENSSAGR